MSTYLKNMAGYKHIRLKNKSFEDIQKLFDKEMKRVNTFVYMDTELAKGSETRTEGSETRAKGSETRAGGSSKRPGDELQQESTKKQKVDDDKEEEDLKQCFEIVPDEEIVFYKYWATPSEKQNLLPRIFSDLLFSLLSFFLKHIS
ncbi:hypothetical protein Tco_0912264 [Tanacetum coccineum]